MRREEKRRKGNVIKRRIDSKITKRRYKIIIREEKR
jgi:hypothetical protein